MGRQQVDKVNQNVAKPEADALELVHKIMHLVRAAQYGVLRDGGHELTHLEGKLLGRLADRPGTTLSELVARFGRDKGQLARVVKALKVQGLLETRKDPADGRTVQLQLTAKGLKLHLAIRQQLLRVKKAALRGVGPAEEAQLVELLERVRSNLEGEGAAGG